MVKRTFDFFLSLFGIVLSAPLWLVILLAILIEDGWPVFYPQERVGQRGGLFRALKFRSMIKGAERGIGPVQAVENDSRVTRVGRLLRATAMDELPQLINILKGDMSFVGPRALRPAELEVRGDASRLRLDEIPGSEERLAVRPGLTGVAQIYLSKDAPRQRKFRYDALYVRRQNFGLDVKLILFSFWITLRGKWESRKKGV